MTELVVNKEEFELAIGRLETLVDGFTRPRNLIHSINDQDETLWASVSGTATLRRDFSLTLSTMQRDIDGIWSELKNLGKALEEAGRELDDVDESSREQLAALTARMEEDPDYISGVTPTFGGGFGLTPVMV